MWYNSIMNMLVQEECDNRKASKTLKIMSSKWTMLILQDLCVGTKRFGQLQKSMAGISPKTLSQRLQQLEKAGIVQKHVFAEVPLHVEYSLTKKGAELKKIFRQIEHWEITS